MTFERLREALTGREENAIMPLFWQKGGPVETVREEMERIAEAGIGSVILEARPHPEFLEDGWWRDVDAVLQIARERGMTVWFFDDDTFPTGHAGGAVREAPPHLRRRFLTERHTDVVGPAPGASLLVERRQFWGPAAALDPGVLLGAIAYRRAEDSHDLIGEPLDLTGHIVDGLLHWDVPDGWWRVFFLSAVGDGGSARHADHIDYLNADSTQLLIDSVHERILARYRDEFGGVIAGFFSDEPGLYNDPDTFDFTSALGRPVPLPWNDAVQERLTRALRSEPLTALPLLWNSAGGRELPVRHAFMDAVSSLYSENFSRRIGDWCRAHGVEYIGHVIEDNGAHARMGPGAGHYFRAMAGQSMTGIDIIGGQVIPGFARGPFANMPGHADGEFFHFGLAKLASSAAHLDPRTRGRSMCETVGAYGWYAGLRLFTWLTNHLLVRGVTHVVPHAFSPADFPDLDCPPHFYARGRNPQYRHHHLLSAYTNRLSHLLQGGRHVAPFAVLYHADAEWLGDTVPSEHPLRLLMESQLDVDIVPADALAAASVVGAALSIGQEEFDALIVPGSDRLPGAIARQLVRLDDAGVPVVFVGRVPLAVETGPGAVPLDPAILRRRFIAVADDGLVDAIAPLTSRAVRVAGAARDLRVLRIAHDEADVLMLVNESTSESVALEISIPRAGEVVAFDAAVPSATRISSRSADGITAVDIALVPGAAMVLLVGDPEAWDDLPLSSAERPEDAEPLDVVAWDVSTATASEYPVFTPWRTVDGLRPIGAPDLLPRFSGTLRYRATFPSPSGPGGRHRLDLGAVYELATVRVNGTELGTRIAPPYVFDVPSGVLARDHENEIEIDVVNTLAPQERDFFSAFAQQSPSGLLGPVTIATLVTPEGPLA